MDTKAHIKVVITNKTRKFRARIIPRDGSPAFEVNVGGTSWKEGKGKEYHPIILDRCGALLNYLAEELEKAR